MSASINPVRSRERLRSRSTSNGASRALTADEISAIYNATK